MNSKKIIEHESDAAACFGLAYVRQISTEAHASWKKSCDLLPPMPAGHEEQHIGDSVSPAPAI